MLSEGVALEGRIVSMDLGRRAQIFKGFAAMICQGEHLTCFADPPSRMLAVRAVDWVMRAATATSWYNLAMMAKGGL